MEILSEVEKSWIAGFIDGEGCINLSPTRNIFQVRVMIVNANLEVLEWIKSIYGGWIYHREPRFIGWKPCHQYTVCSRKAMKLLKDVGKYLKVKQKQYKIALDYEKTINLPRKSRVITINNITERNKITGQIIHNKVKIIPNPKILEIRQQLRQNLKQLNRRGI